MFYKTKRLILMMIWFYYMIGLLLQANVQDFSFDVSYATTTKILSLKQAKRLKYQSISSSSIDLGFKDEILWVKVAVKNHSDDSYEAVLSVENPTIDEIVFFDSNRSVVTGDRYRLDTREIDGLGFGFHITLKPHSKQIYYFRIYTHNTLSVPISLQSPKEYLKKSYHQVAIVSAYAGFMFALIVYNILLFMLLKERPFFYYVVFQTFYLITLVGFSGVGYRFLWRENVTFNEMVLRGFDDLSIISFIMFVVSFLQVKERFRRLYIAAYIAVAMSIVAMFWGRAIGVGYVQITMFGSILLIVFIVLQALRHRVAYAGYIFVGTTLLTIGAWSLLLKNFGWIETTALTQWAIYILSAIEGVLFSFIISKRIEAIKSEQKALQIRLNRSLEREVLKKTEHIEVLIKELRHRVKNNLQVIASFIDIASYDPSPKQALRQLKRRVRIVSLLHEHLDDAFEEQHIPLNRYLPTIVSEVCALYDSKIDQHVEIEPVTVSWDKAMSIGLILNELVTNALTHAFEPSQHNRRIIVVLYLHNRRCTLVVEDNGKGIEPSMQRGIGLKLIEKMVHSRLHGEFKITPLKRGSRATLSFVL